MKHTHGDFNKWITLFEDQITTCETVGVELSEESKVLYFMNNLNDSIFGEIKANYMNLSTRCRKIRVSCSSSLVVLNDVS